MTTSRVVEPFDVIEDVRASFVSCAIPAAIHALNLERGEEAFHRRIVPAITATAHAATNAMLSQQSLELLRRVLAALIGMMQQLLWPAAAPDRHQQCVDHELRGHLRVHRPTT